MVAHSQLSYKVDLTMKWTPKNDSLNEIYLKNSIKQHLYDILNVKWPDSKLAWNHGH